ncbi:MAG: NAD-dependent epimerase/dehydratase family protein [Thermodesulfobacteriota bacterium]|nr:NAD-dependent epimerase/dehydratase family protein [Thermodesulfobacteriota bacterium]
MIHWITEYLGTSSWDQVDRSLDANLMDVRDLVDKSGNAPAAVKAKIDEALNYLRKGEKVVICCDYGMSRSNAIAAGILSLYEGIDVNEAIRRVTDATNETGIKLEVLSAMREALGAKVREPRMLEEKREILVTGAFGFIGRRLVHLMGAEYRVVSPTRQEIDLLKDAIKLDLLVKEHGVDILIHLANPRVHTTNDAMGQTLVMLKNVLDVCAENRLFLIYLSNWEIYAGYKAQELRGDESLVPCPDGTYGQTKFLCEALIEHYGQHKGLSYTVLRSSPVYGPGSDRPRFIWNFLEKARSNEDIVAHRYINGYPKLDLLHVDDLCRAILAAAGCRLHCSMNLGTGVGVSTTEVAQLIVELVNSRSGIRHIDIEAFTSNIVMVIQRARQVLNWQPAIDFTNGLTMLLNKQKQVSHV